MRIPGVGPISALAFKTAVDDPQSVPPLEDGGGLSRGSPRDGGSRAPRSDVQGHISRAGDGEVRHRSNEAANIMLTRFRGFSSLKAWGLKIAKKRGHKRACVAVARKLAVIMHAMWRDGTEFRFEAAADTTQELLTLLVASGLPRAGRDCAWPSRGRPRGARQRGGGGHRP